MGTRRFFAALALLLAVSCGGASPPKPTPQSFSLEPASAPIELSSTGFAEGAVIPVRYTCDGANVSPPLKWSRVPSDAVELVLIMEDSDAPRGFVHWVVFRIEPDEEGVAEGRIPQGARQAKGTSGEVGYVGPCPPRGDKPHRYTFSITALSRHIDLPNGVPAEQVMDELRSSGITGGDTYGDYKRR